MAGRSSTKWPLMAHATPVERELRVAQIAARRRGHVERRAELVGELVDRATQLDLWGFGVGGDDMDDAARRDVVDGRVEGLACI